MMRSTLLLSLAVAVGSPAGGQVDRARTVVRPNVRQRVIIRVPPMIRVPVSEPTVWRERKGPRCISANMLAGAIVRSRDAVDLVMRGGKRLRARMDGACRGAVFYAGFYLKPAADGMVCADRDVFRARSGATCPIDGFRRLEPKR